MQRFELSRLIDNTLTGLYDGSGSLLVQLSKLPIEYIISQSYSNPNMVAEGQVEKTAGKITATRNQNRQQGQRKIEKKVPLSFVFGLSGHPVIRKWRCQLTFKLKKKVKGENQIADELVRLLCSRQITSRSSYYRPFVTYSARSRFFTIF